MFLFVGIYLCRCVDILNMFPLWVNKNDIIVLICKFMKVGEKTFLFVFPPAL